MRRAALLLLALPIALVGCGGGKSSSSAVKLTPVAYVKSAAKKTAQAPSERATLKGLVTTAGQTVTATGGGVFDNTKRTGSLHLDFTLSGLSGSIDEVLDGTTIYLRSPFFSDNLPKGKTWLKLDLQKALASKGIDFSALLSQNPSQSLSQLESVGTVRTVGEETIGGAATTHYRVRVDLSKLPQAAQIKALTRVRYRPYDVWIGKDDGYVHRVSFGYSFRAGARRTGISFTMDFSDFGKGVSVTVPSAAESFDATNLSIPGLGG